MCDYDGGNKLRIQPLSGGNSWLTMRGSSLVQSGKALSSRPIAGGGARHDHYRVKMKGVTVDAYDIIDACAVTCPALQHIAKKALFTGKRGHKSTQEDLENIIDTAIRALGLHHERQ